MRIITVKGTGNVSARPDYIILSLNIEVLSETYDRAMSEAAERIERLQGAAVRVGYRKEDLKTTSFDVQTRYENVKDRQGNYKREFAGYACSYRLKLAFDFDSKQLAKVISAIADCGAQPELSIAFTVKNPARVSEELLINATENARAKAEILCKASGSTLGRLPISIKPSAETKSKRSFRVAGTYRNGCHSQLRRKKNVRRTHTI